MSNETPALSHLMRFVLAWMIAPTLFRLFAFIGMASRLHSPWQTFYVGGWSLTSGLPQDLFIALQFVFIVVILNSLLRRLEPGRRNRIVAIATTVLFAAVHLYLLFDFFLHLKMGLRMDCTMLEFLPVARSFASSAWEFGLGILLAGAALLGASMFLAYRLFLSTAGTLRFSLGLAAALPLVALLALPARKAIPAQLGYALNNLVLNDEYKLVTNLIAPGLRLSASDESAAIELLTPRAEEFERVSPKYPLLKRTLGFHGEKTFEVHMAPNERPHVVFLFMESFRAADIGVLGGEHDASPHFDRLSKQGVLFKNFYANGVQTTRGVIASLFGVLPCFSMKSIQGSNPGLPMIGIADLFHRRGYTSAYLSSGDLAFENQDLFFGQQGFDEMHAEDQIVKAFPHAQRTSWGYHDEYLMRYLADWLQRKDRAGKSAFAVAFTISHHHPWKIPSGYQPPTFEVGENSQYGKFLQTFHYADHCLGLFVDLLRQRGLDRKTILFVLADTAAPMGEHFGNALELQNLYEENVHIPLLILAPGRLERPVVIHDIGSQIDLLPTVMDMFDMRGLNHAVGTTLMRRVQDRTAYFNSPFVLKYLGLRRGGHKYFYAVDARTPAVFDLTKDPRERRNMAGQVPDLVGRFHEDVTLVHQLFLKLYVTGRLASPDAVETVRTPQANE